MVTTRPIHQICKLPFDKSVVWLSGAAEVCDRRITNRFQWITQQRYCLSCLLSQIYSFCWIGRVEHISWLFWLIEHSPRCRPCQVTLLSVWLLHLYVHQSFVNKLLAMRTKIWGEQYGVTAKRVWRLRKKGTGVSNLNMLSATCLHI